MLFKSVDWTRFVCSVAMFSIGLVSLVNGQVNLPVLNWQPQGDWINVKSAPYNAVGNGATDDANAINTAFNAMTGSSVIYFPAGTYRITKQLNMGTTGNRQQCWMVGCGKNTVIKCDFPSGSTDSVMFHPRGAWGAEFNGITWDGSNKASIAIYHNPYGYNYEGDMRHENEAFLNFTGAAIKTPERFDPNIVGVSNNPTAEIVIRNCLFSNCKKGIAILWFNFFNWNVEGCEFRDCGVGVRAQAYGYGYYRFNHFERSTEYDFQLEFAASQTIRWCTSVGSRRFASGQRCWIEDCSIKGIVEKDSAIILSSTRGPFIVSDVFMQDWNSATAPLVFNVYSDHDQDFAPITVPQQLIVSNVQCTGSPTPTTMWRGGDGNAKVTEIAAGSRSTPMFPAEKSFLKQNVDLRIGARVPTGSWFNVKTEGAIGNGTTNDQAAIQSAINKAIAANNGSCVYIPSGNYKVNSPLVVSGSNYYIMGTGIGSALKFGGTAGNPIFMVAGAKNVVFSNLGMRNESFANRPATCPAIKHLGSASSKSFVIYNRIWTLASGYRNIADDPNGLHFENLTVNDTALINQCTGEFRAKNSSQGTIVSLWSPFTIAVVEGTSPKTGFMGMVSGNFGQIRVYNSQNLVVADNNIEQSDGNYTTPNNAQYNAVLVAGNDGDLPGRVTMGYSRQTVNNTDTLVRMRNFCGSLNLVFGEIAADGGPGTTGFKYAPLGNNPIFVTFMGTRWPGDKGITLTAQLPKLNFPAFDTLAIIQTWGLPNSIKGSALGKAATAFNDFRALGEWVYKLDYDVNAAVGNTQNPNLKARNYIKPRIGMNGERLTVSCAQNFAVEIFTMQGALVWRSVNNNLNGGSIDIPASKITGIYLAKVVSNDGVLMEKMVALR